MSIRLNALNNYANAGKIASVNKLKSDKANVAETPKTVSDSISISSGANNYSTIAKIQSGISVEVNSLSSAEYVSSLKAQVKNGEYNVSSEDVAAKILDRFA